MESCAPGLTTGNFVFSFPFIEKLYTLVCSTVLASLQAEAVGQGIAIPAKVEHKGRVIFIYWEKRKLNGTTCTNKYVRVR